MTEQIRTYRQGIANIGPGFKPGYYPDPQWVDINFDILAITIPGNNNAPQSFVIPGTGLVLPSFPDGVITEAPGSVELDHGWKLGTEIRPHVHVRKLTSGAGSIYLAFEYLVLRGTTKIYGTKEKIVSVTDVVQYDEDLIVPFDPIDVSAIDNVGTQITFRLYRDANNVADNYVGSIGSTTAGLHILVDTDGSQGVGNK